MYVYVKIQQKPSPLNKVIEHDFWPKAHAQASMCELVRYHLAGSMIGFRTIQCVSDMYPANNFKGVFLIDRENS